MDPDERRGPLERAVDLCILAPIGLVSDASSVVPELVERGRGQVAQARAVGRFTVQKAGGSLGGKVRDAQRLGVETLRRIASQGSESPPGTGGGDEQDVASQDAGGPVGPDRLDAPAGRDSSGLAPGQAQRPDLRPVPDPGVEEPSVDGPAAGEPAASSDHLAIPGYDSLSASQVVPRLESLAPDELEAVRLYEAGSRARKTILGRIGQLQRSTG